MNNIDTLIIMALVVVALAIFLFFLWLWDNFVTGNRQATRLVDQSTKTLCSCGREVTPKQIIDDYKKCVYCILDESGMNTSFINLDENRKVKTAIAKPEEV